VVSKKNRLFLPELLVEILCVHEKKMVDFLLDKIDFDKSYKTIFYRG
jgi:hypothetical protein